MIAGLLLSAAATAQTQQDELQEIEGAITAGKDRQDEISRTDAVLAAELKDLQARMIATAEAAQQQEQTLNELDETLATLTDEEAVLTDRLRQSEAQMMEALMALQRLSLHPPDSLVSLRSSATHTVRGALLLRAAVPELETRAAALSDDLTRLASLRADIESNRADFRTGLAALDNERAALEVLVGQKRGLRRSLQEESAAIDAQLAALTARAEDLESLLEELERESLIPPGLKPQILAPPEPRSFADARGNLTPPARGRVVQRYGDDLGLGAVSRGITIETRPNAAVVAPFDGQVVFAGPFRGYGRILIIEHSDGYHTLLAGLVQNYAETGQWVLAGEPIGAVGQDEGEPPRLYVELRRSGQPINPSPWMKLATSKEGE